MYGCVPRPKKAGIFVNVPWVESTDAVMCGRKAALCRAFDQKTNMRGRDAEVEIVGTRVNNTRGLRGGTVKTPAA